MKFRINADLFRAVSVAVSTEETRYYLCGVNVEPHPVRGVILTATDGHRLLCAHDENGETDGTYIVPAGKDVIRATKIGGPDRRRTGGGLVMVAEGGSVTFRNAHDMPTVTLPVQPIDGSFPDWRRVLPGAPFEGAAAVSSFNPAYVSDLADVCTDLKASGFDDVAFTMAAADPGSPALVNYGAAPIFGVLMPMRNSIPLAVPSWVRARPADAFAAADLGPVVQDQAPSDAPSCPSDAPSIPADDAPQPVVQDEPAALHKPMGDEVTRALADRLAEICKAVVTDRNDGADDCEIIAGICGRAWVIDRQDKLCDAVETFDAMPEVAIGPETVKPSRLAAMRAAALSSTAMVPPGVVVPFMPRRAA